MNVYTFSLVSEIRKLFALSCLYDSFSFSFGKIISIWPKSCNGYHLFSIVQHLHQIRKDIQVRVENYVLPEKLCMNCM